MSNRDRALWALATVVCTFCLIAPALWNGFPLLEWDTGGYLARWYDHTLVINRAVAYGLFLNAGSSLAFWPVLVVQSLLTIWVLALMLRAHGLANRPLLLTGMVVVLSAVTTLPWLTAILLTDIFAGLSVFALYLLVFRAGTLSRLEQTGLVLLTAFSAASHSATLAVLAGLVIVAAVVWRIAPRLMQTARLGNAALSLVLGVVIVFAADYVVARQIAWTPGGFSIAFGRMLQDGIVKKYLNAHCPDPELRVFCKYEDQIPENADEFFWLDPLFGKLGGFEKLSGEMERIVLGSLADYPWLQVKTAAIATARQLVAVRTGEGVENTLWHTYGVIEHRLPELVPAMRAARQAQKDSISFNEINALHVPATLAGMAALPLVAALALAGALPATFAELAVTAMLALLGNAIVCGVISNPHDRYGARLAWIGACIALIALAYAFVRLRRPRTQPLPAPEPLFY